MIPVPHTAGKTYLVLGLGKSGNATALSLIAGGAQVSAWDDSEAARQNTAQQNIPLADPATIDWRKIAALVMSPGIPHTYPAPHPVAAAAKEAGVPLTGDIELLFQAQPEAKHIGVTGANGKSTTTALIGYILHQAGRRAETGGNLGTPALALAPLDKDGIYVLELSSYQLELIAHNRLDIAVLLNISPDHLERHGGMTGYIAAKTRIIRQDAPQIFICGIDDKPSRAVAAQAAAMPHIQLRTISQNAQPDCAVYADNGHLIDNLAGKAEKILDLRALPHLPGKHNWQNIAAAYAACHALGLPRTSILAGIKSFPALDHRQQLVAVRGGVRYINDSKATNAEAAGKALACYDNIYWILGGLPKAGGLQGLEEFTPRIRRAFLIGKAAGAFASWLEGKTPYTNCGTLDVAVGAAAALAEQERLPDATVLLSPACASWDQFKSFEHRGQVFAELVRALPESQTAKRTA